MKAFSEMTPEQVRRKFGEVFDYDDILVIVSSLPRTWYPAVILEAVRAAYREKVFVPGKALKFLSGRLEGEDLS